MTLRFGTAGLRGPVGDGPDCMNVPVVVRTTAGLAAWLEANGQGGGTVVVGRDARTGSAEFHTAAAEVLTAAGFDVVALGRPLPTPVTAFAVRALGAVAGVQITASHNPAADNGYKVYLADGAQLAAPADREIEAAIDAIGDAATVPRVPVAPSGDELVDRYLARVASLPRSPHRAVRIALTALHGVGGETAVAALRAAGFDDIHVVPSQFAPDPAFPTVAFPNPEEAGATDALLALAAEVDADLAFALDPDADRCAVGVPTPQGWTMFRGDETGVLLGDRILASSPPGSLVATTVVSSTMLGRLAAARGARYAQTLTGFKWLARAGDGLVYAYEEAIGHCVDPEAVRDKDGVATAVVTADYAAELKQAGRTLTDALDDLHRELGVHVGGQVSIRVDDLRHIGTVMTRLRSAPPATLAGLPVTAIDLAESPGPMHTDALVFESREDVADGPRVRVVVRPSGTEPKLKVYLEVVAERDRPAAETILDALRGWAASLGDEIL
ncbi:phospho-sugar mutase [Rhodococcus gordoniae]|uniref:phospho-sugar mutase n=1 Tax=Rhodococcus gordoniae TaxID=223392 RepID=UPI0020CE5855|nr:phospho-sugar mutase [Rhodococcus gordoniae]UTT47511.1 phospho-sugar mutase [Rhodococcus gordoniae]